MNNTVLSSASQDVVGVFDQKTFNQVFTDARPMKAKVNETASVMSHPVEDGTSVTDHKVINPVDIELSMIIDSSDYRSVYKTIKQHFIKSTLLVVQTRTDVYRSMIISAMPHDEDPAIFDSVTIAVKLAEVKFATFTRGRVPTVSKPKDDKNSKTQDTGKKQPTEATNAGKKQSILKGWAG